MGIAGAIIGASVIGTAGMAIASSSASDAATNAANQNNATTLGIYNQNKANATPFINNGTAANNDMAALLGVGGNSTAAQNAFTKYLGSTGYNFQLGQGLNAVNNNYATHGALDSGASLKALNDYAQGQASNAFQNYFGNLGTLSGTGLSATNALAGVGTNVSQQISSNNNNAAAAQGNAAISIGNSLNNGLGTAVNALTSSSYGGGGYAGVKGWQVAGLTPSASETIAAHPGIF